MSFDDDNEILTTGRVELIDEPNVNPSSLRFRVGDLVLFKEDNGWFEGEIWKVCQRLNNPPNSWFVPYVVWPHSADVNGPLCHKDDTDDFIRPRPKDLTPDPEKLRPHQIFPGDPYAYLYTGFTINPYDKDGKSTTEEFTHHSIDTTSINPDGSVQIKYKDNTTINTALIDIPQEPIQGVPGIIVVKSGEHIFVRRHYKDFANSKGVFDPISLFKSILPSESTFSELEAASKTSSDKMLQLGDALMFGVYGITKDGFRANNCYRAAAWGCQEDEAMDRTGVPVGNPEAMLSLAYSAFLSAKRKLPDAEDLGDSLPFDEVLCYCLENVYAMNILHNMIYWTSKSLKQGWLSPFALGLASCLAEYLAVEPVPDYFRESCSTLLKVHEYREKEKKYDEMQEDGRIPRGDPGDSIIELFRPKAKEIFLNLPVTSETIHIEYREVPRHPFPLAIYVVIPVQKVVLKVITLPEALQVSPFSQESFEYVWMRIAFAIHLGKPGSSERTRPSIFTVLDSHGNREFASYLGNVLSDSNTQIRLVSHADKIKMGRKKKPTSTLGHIIQEIENSLLEIPGLLYDGELADEEVVSGAQREFVRHYMRDSMDMVGKDPTRDLAAAEDIKAQGNALFVSKDFNGASRRYSVAIQLLSHFVEHDQKTYRLLGTLLSNRAACYLELETRMSNMWFRKFLAQNAMKDCLVALKSSWASTALPQSILQKLKFRHDKASARYDALSNRSECDEPIISPEDQGRNTNEEAHNRNEGSASQRKRRRRQRGRRQGPAGTVPEPSSVEAEQAGNNNQSTKSLTKVHVVERDENEVLMEYGKVLHDNCLARNAEDGCPICIREFCGELSKTYTAVLACGEHALCVECICNLKKEADKAHAGLSCPLCRTAIAPDFVENLAYQMIEVDQELAMLVSKLPLDDISDSVNVSHRLLWSHNFQVEKVVDVLESMLDDQVRSLFFRDTVNLTHTQKEDIYRQARRPVDVLKERVTRLVEERKTTFEINRLNKLEKDIRELRSDLATSRRNAREEIYSQLNSVGTMGGQQDSAEGNGLIQIDFHGLHVGEMQTKFSEHVKPILPVVKSVMIITGRGLHNSSGESKLKKALIKRIEQHENDIRWEKIDDNPGAINVLWKPAH